MQLRLKHEPVPGNAARFADDIVVSAAQISGVELDYTPDSLSLVDDIFDNFRADGVTSGQVGETLFGFGCYAGEVLVRHAGGRWRAPTAGEQDLVGWPLLVELGDQRWCNPIGKAAERLDNGPEDSLRYFYTVFSQGSGGSSGEQESRSR